MTRDIDTALVDVRRAFRLLWAYHRRIADTLAIVDGHLESRGLSFQRWRPSHFNRPATGPFFARGKWAWDMLPGLDVHLVWGAELDGTVWETRIWLDADDGWDWGSKNEPDPADWPTAPEDSQSTLTVYLLRAPVEAGTQFVIDALEERDWGDHEIEVGGARHPQRCRSWLLQELPDRAAIESELLSSLDEWLIKHGPRVGSRK